MSPLRGIPISFSIVGIFGVCVGLLGIGLILIGNLTVEWHCNCQGADHWVCEGEKCQADATTHFEATRHTVSCQRIDWPIRLLEGIFAFIMPPSKTPPLAPLGGESPIRVEIDGYVMGHRKLRCALTDPKDVATVVGHLTGLEPKLYDHSDPKFTIRIFTATGKTVVLRVSEKEIGPDAPASALNTHWSLKSSALHDFLKQRTREQCEPERP